MTLYMISWPTGYRQKEVRLANVDSHEVVKVFNKFSDNARNKKQAFEWLKDQGYMHTFDPNCDPQEWGGYREIYIRKESGAA